MEKTLTNEGYQKVHFDDEITDGKAKINVVVTPDLNNKCNTCINGNRVNITKMAEIMCPICLSPPNMYSLYCERK